MNFTLCLAALIQGGPAWIRLEAHSRDSVSIRARTELPDGAIVAVRVGGERERYDEERGELAPARDGAASVVRRVRVERGTLTLSVAMSRPHGARVAAAFDPEAQSSAVRAALVRSRYEAVEATAPCRPGAVLGPARRDAGRVLEWIGRARRGLDEEGEACARALRTLRERCIVPAEQATLCPAAADRLNEAIQRFVLEGRAEGGATGGLERSLAPPKDAVATLRAELERCERIAQRELLLWHVRCLRGRTDVEAIAESLRDVAMEAEWRREFEAALREPAPERLDRLERMIRRVDEGTGVAAEESFDVKP
jgi:hypothetical protein